MARDTFDYPRMIARALRGVARQALAHTAEHGLPGEHHFYLSFRTGGEGVRVPGFLRDQYPDEMTIVLQNQFWDLVVDDDAFSVSLTFNGARQRIVVPWGALTAFADPSAQVGLRFEPPADDAEGGEEAAGAESAEEGSGAPASPFAAAAAEAGVDISPRDGGERPAEPAPEGNAKVVRLDRFRRRADDGGDEDREAVTESGDETADEGGEGPATDANEPSGPGGDGPDRLG